MTFVTAGCCSVTLALTVVVPVNNKYQQFPLEVLRQTRSHLGYGPYSNTREDVEP